jgi:FixJ family two-component response regulator
MESVKQTAVEWLIEQLKKPYSDKYIMDIIEQAKEMEKEQHKETWFSSTLQFANESEMLYKKDFEQYFNEKFKNK